MYWQAHKAAPAIVKRGRASYRKIGVNPLTPIMGAEIDGISLTSAGVEQFAGERQAV